MRAASATDVQRRAVDQLHDDEGLVAGVVDVEHADDVRVVQPVCGAGVVEEARDEARVPARLLFQDLDREGALEDRVRGGEDLGHGPLADLLPELVAPDLISRLHVVLPPGSTRPRREARLCTPELANNGRRCEELKPKRVVPPP
jgi:hypothetical protein